jgi:hypothetical protein
VAEEGLLLFERQFPSATAAWIASHVCSRATASFQRACATAF